MQASLSSYLDLLDPWISPQLIAPPYLDRIKKISQGLPVLSFGCFECWLGADEPRVDFNVAINGRLNEHKTYYNWVVDSLLYTDLSPIQIQKKIQPIFSDWKEEDFHLRSMLRLVWLVYDNPDTLIQLPEPWLYAHFRKTLLDNIPEIRTEALLKILVRLGPLIPAASLEKYRSFMDSIPTSIQIMSIGRPVTRGGENIRVYLIIQTFEQVTTFLENSSWLGNIQELKTRVTEIKAVGQMYGLSFDLGSDLTILPKIGLEVWFEGFNEQTHLADFTQRLVDQKICAEEKRQALLKWKGQFEVETPSEFWSWPDVKELTGDEKQPLKVQIRRMARYIKIVYQPGSPLISKAYLYFDRPVGKM